MSNMSVENVPQIMIVSLARKDAIVIPRAASTKTLFAENAQKTVIAIRVLAMPIIVDAWTMMNVQ